MQHKVGLVFSCALLISISSLRSVQPARNSTADCRVLERKATDCVRVGIGFLDIDFEPPRNQRAVNEFCTSREKYVKCARQYTQCLTTVPRQMYIIVIQNVKRLLHEVCADAKKADFIQHLRCVNRQTLPRISDPISRLSEYYSYVARNITGEDNLIPWTCCAYFSFYQQFQESLASLCQPAVTPESTIQFYFKSINQVVSDAIDLGCGQYSSKQECDRKLPQAMALFSEGNFDPVPRIDFLTPLLAIAKRIS